MKTMRALGAIAGILILISSYSSAAQAALSWEFGFLTEEDGFSGTGSFTLGGPNMTDGLDAFEYSGMCGGIPCAFGLDDVSNSQWELNETSWTFDQLSINAITRGDVVKWVTIFHEGLSSVCAVLPQPVQACPNSNGTIQRQVLFPSDQVFLTPIHVDIPEPPALALFLLALGGLGVVMRRRSGGARERHLRNHDDRLVKYRHSRAQTDVCDNEWPFVPFTFRKREPSPIVEPSDRYPKSWRTGGDVMKTMLGLQGLVMGLGCVLFLSTPQSANAAFISFSDRGDWQAAVTVTGGEDFNGFVSNQAISTTPILLSDGISVGADSGSSFIDAPPLNNVGQTSVDGSAVIATFNDNNLFFTFMSPIGAFGADFASLNNDLERTGIEIYDGNTLLDTLMPPVVIGEVDQFFGFFGTGGMTFTRIRVVRVGNGDLFGIDNIEIGASEDSIQVPEPSTLALIAIALGGLGFMALRRMT